MRTLEDALEELNNAIEEAEKYAAELKDCTPNTTGYQLHEYWEERKARFESVIAFIRGQKDSLKVGCRLY